MLLAKPKQPPVKLRHLFLPIDLPQYFPFHPEFSTQCSLEVSVEMRDLQEFSSSQLASKMPCIRYMNKRFLLSTTGAILLSLFFAVPAKADTLLVGTSLTNTNAGPVLCPKVAGCDIEFSQFSSPVAFTIDDIKIVMGAPATVGDNTNGNFQVTLLSQLGTIGVPVGSGNLPMTLMGSSAANVEVFDFSGLSI